MGAQLAGDLPRSGSNPDTAFLQTEIRWLDHDGCAADRDQGLLPQVNRYTFTFPANGASLDSFQATSSATLSRLPMNQPMPFQPA